MILLIVVLVFHIPWPTSWQQTLHIAIAGALLAGIFSIGTWISMAMGLPPAISALIIALQPLLVAIIANLLLKETINLLQWLGFIFGLLGIVLVVGEEVHLHHISSIAILMSFLGLLGLTLGSLYQKHFCTNMNVFSGGFIQAVSSATICIPFNLFFTPLHLHWNVQFIFALVWMGIIVSIGGLSILYLLLRHGKASKVASIFYLVPIVTAILAYFIFGTHLNLLQLFGILLTVTGVALVNVKLDKAILFLKNKMVT